MQCEARKDVTFVCVRKDDTIMYTAKPSNDDEIVQCPQDASLPWRTQALCSQSTGCYQTTFGEEDVRVCVNGDALRANPTALHNLPLLQPITGDKPSDSQTGFHPCYMHKLGDFEDGSVVVWTKDRSTCERMSAVAHKQCSKRRDSHECEQSIRDLYHDAEEKSYVCAPPKELNVDQEWAAWVRVNTIVEDPSDAHVFRRGVCGDDGKCVAGNAQGTHCARHEHCDRSAHVAPNAETSRVRVEYLAPTTCEAEGPRETQYCGAVTKHGRTQYTGVCRPHKLNGVERQACKPFESQDEIDELRRNDDEAQRNPTQNFYANSAPWENLTLCQDKAVIDGVEVCRSTRTSVVDHTTLARSEGEANARCDARACAEKDPTCGIGVAAYL